MEPVRAEDWNHHPLPDRHAVLAVDRAFDSEEMRAIRLGLCPEVMEDKWFVYFEDERLHFHRSWTGNCLFVARFETQDDGGSLLVDALVNRDPEQYRSEDDAYDVRLLVSLIDGLLLGREFDLPTRSTSDTERALEFWGVAGRATLGHRAPPGRER